MPLFDFILLHSKNVKNLLSKCFFFSVAVNDIRAWNRFHEVQHQTTPIQIQKSGQGHQGISGETRSRLHSSGMMNLNGPGKEAILPNVTRIKTNEARWLFSSHFWPLLKQASFLEATGAVVKIGLSLKPDHHKQIKPS